MKWPDTKDDAKVADRNVNASLELTLTELLLFQVNQLSLGKKYKDHLEIMRTVEQMLQVKHRPALILQTADPAQSSNIVDERLLVFRSMNWRRLKKSYVVKMMKSRRYVDNFSIF